MLSIIIPVLNEARTVEKLLIYLSENISGKNATEIILIDGGSIDGTISKIKNFNHSIKPSTTLRVIIENSEKGRAKQMNKGAQAASGDVLYFLHADSFPPKNFDNYIFSEVNKGNPAGCFRMKFDSNHWWLELAGWLTKFKWQCCRGGDQSQFITKVLFEEIGGFDENFIIYEDNILISELYKRKCFVVIPQALITSARRYRELGIWKLQYHFWVIHLKKWLGADAVELHAYYAKHIGAKNQNKTSQV